MTHGELKKARRYAPFILFQACFLPLTLKVSKDIEQAKFLNQFIVPVLALLAAFVYVGLDLRSGYWEEELDDHVRKQIREALLGMVPADLNVTDVERQQLTSEIMKTLTGVFWEAVDRNQVLKTQKEHFYANGALYTTSIDVLLIGVFAALVYSVAAFLQDNAFFGYVAAAFLAASVFSGWLVKPKARRRHMKLSAEQIDVVRRGEGAAIAARFREIINDWRAQRAAAQVDNEGG
jgi:hypothetical protein